MEKIKISEQEIINSLCVYIADKRRVSPEQVEMELMYDDDYGFSAEAHVNGRSQILITANIIEALRFYIEHELNRDPFAAKLELKLDDDEGIIAYVQ
ncbi:YxcD family protein [Peribacillus sp. FSL H8-0477]|uniref:YxcD family protein n=1 Tax=Peribacillus sp. FSL H8-0477 TaxID=2921388 RepID=UPI0030F87DBE